MRAIKYGVTSHQVLALEAVLATGEVIRTGGKFVKSSTGYDLTQLIVGSEGTLALVTEATVKLYPRARPRRHRSRPVRQSRAGDGGRAADRGQRGGADDPRVHRHADDGRHHPNVGLDLGIPKEVQEKAAAYLVVVLENTQEDRLDEDIGRHWPNCWSPSGALEVYVLPQQAAGQLIGAREKAFFVAKADGADDIIDVVVPRAAIPAFLATAAEVANSHATLRDGLRARRRRERPPVGLPTRSREAGGGSAGHLPGGMDLGGAISGEHGIGTAKKRYFEELEDPTKVALMRRIKEAFDPHGILGPDVLFGRPTNDGGDR